MVRFHCPVLGSNDGRGWQVRVERRHCPSSWLALLQDRWQWPGSPPGGSCHGLGPSPSPSPEEPGAPGPGVQGFSVLSSVVGPACIFLRPSIAATQLVCTATTCLPPAPTLAPRFCLSLSAGRGLSGGLTAKARGSRDVGDREAWRSRHKIKTGGKTGLEKQARKERRVGQRATRRNGRDRSHQGDGQGGDRAPKEEEREQERRGDPEAPMAKPEGLPNPSSSSG